MELQDLCGKHMLDAVDFSQESRKRWSDDYEDCQVCRFRLNGTVYAAVEDPSDGYRSSMNDLVIDSGAKMQNVFPPIEVVGVYRTKGSWGYQDDVLELVDATTGKVILEVGTSNCDDYYPCFVASFHPENMITNLADGKPVMSAAEAIKAALWMVESFEGTSDENDKIVDAYRAARKAQEVA